MNVRSGYLSATAALALLAGATAAPAEGTSHKQPGKLATTQGMTGGAGALTLQFAAHETDKLAERGWGRWGGYHGYRSVGWYRPAYYGYYRPYSGYYSYYRNWWYRPSYCYNPYYYSNYTICGSIGETSNDPKQWAVAQVTVDRPEAKVVVKAAKNEASKRTGVVKITGK